MVEVLPPCKPHRAVQRPSARHSVPPLVACHQALLPARRRQRAYRRERRPYACRRRPCARRHRRPYGPHPGHHGRRDGCGRRASADVDAAAPLSNFGTSSSSRLPSEAGYDRPLAVGTFRRMARLLLDNDRRAVASRNRRSSEHPPRAAWQATVLCRSLRMGGTAETLSAQYVDVADIQRAGHAEGEQGNGHYRARAARSIRPCAFRWRWVIYGGAMKCQPHPPFPGAARCAARSICRLTEDGYQNARVERPHIPNMTRTQPPTNRPRSTLASGRL